MILCLDNYIRTKIKNIKEMIKYKHYKTIAWHQKQIWMQNNKLKNNKHKIKLKSILKIKHNRMNFNKNQFKKLNKQNLNHNYIKTKNHP